jgi:hypothetical protein
VRGGRLELGRHDPADGERFRKHEGNKASEQ